MRPPIPASYHLLCMCLITCGVTLFMSACNDAECESDDECSVGEQCVMDTLVCEVKVVPDCRFNADCEGAQQCFSGEGETGAVCRLPNNCTESDDVNTYCRETQGALGEERYSCNTQNDTCVLESESCPSDSACVDPAQPDLRCLPVDDEPDAKSICRLPVNCSEAKDVLAFCRAAAGDRKDYSCSPSSIDPDRSICTEFVTPTRAGSYIYIKDLSTEDCDLAEDANGFDPGSDITFVELQDAAMMTLGWGKTVSYNPADTKNDFKVETVLDGREPDLITTGEQEDIDNRCPAGDSAGRFSTASALVLGCGGGVLVNFPQGSSFQQINTGDHIIVGEYAPVCNSNVGGSITGTTDLYEVYLCPADDDPSIIPSDIDCIIKGTLISTSSSGGLKSMAVK